MPISKSHFNWFMVNFSNLHSSNGLFAHNWNIFATQLKRPISIIFVHYSCHVLKVPYLPISKSHYNWFIWSISPIFILVPWDYICLTIETWIWIIICSPLKLLFTIIIICSRLKLLSSHELNLNMDYYLLTIETWSISPILI